MPEASAPDARPEGGPPTPGLTSAHCPTPEPGHPTGTELFVTGGGLDGRVGVSLDGSQWVDRTTVTAGPRLSDHTRNMIRGVGFGAGLFVAVGGFDNSYISISCDGINWQHDVLGTNVEAPPNPPHDDFLEEVTALGNVLVAVGGNTARLTSGDFGLTWEATGGDGSGHLRGIAVGRDRLVAVGHDFEGNGVVTVSHDGSSWTPLQREPGDLYHVAFGNDRFVAAGPNRCAVSTDGEAWNDCGAGSSFIEVRFIDGFFYLLDLASGGFLRSTDGSSWSPSPVFLPSATVEGSDRFVMVDIDSRGHSSDLANWNRVTRYGGSSYLTVGRVVFDPR